MPCCLFSSIILISSEVEETPTLAYEAASTSIVVLAAVVFNYFGVRSVAFGVTVDQIGAAVVLVFIARSGWELLSDGMRVLLDASVDPQTLEQARMIMEAEPAVTEVKMLAGRNAGRFRFLQAAVEMRTRDLQKAHRIADNVESKIRREIPHVQRVIIHYEPKSPEHVRLAVPLASHDGDLSPHFGGAPFFALILVRLSDNSIERKEIIENPFREQEKAKGISAAEWLVRRKVDEVLVKEDLRHKGPGYVFSDAGVKTGVTPADRLNEAIDGFLSGRKAAESEH